MFAVSLVMHAALLHQAPDSIVHRHARPATVGEAGTGFEGKTAGAESLHRAPATVKTPEWFSLSDLDEAIAEVRKHFSGPVDAAVDLQCIAVR